MKQIKKILKNVRNLRRLLPGNAPAFIIAGAQKSGTSSLHYFLGQHPQLTPSQPKEIHYFDRKVYQGYSLKWYKKHFTSFSLKPRLYFESSPSYIYHENVAAQLKQHFPGVKIILLLRNPVDRAFSAYNMYKDFFDDKKKLSAMKQNFSETQGGVYKYLFDGRKQFPGFWETIQIELDLIKNGQDKEPAILRRGFYAAQIKDYYKYFDKESILILGFKDFTGELQSTLNTCTRFLGVSNTDVKQLNTENRNKRQYKSEMTSEERKFLEDLYEKPNKELADMLGSLPNW